jgi:TRAP-type mannitol/chloroaromatic compound transport system substrate-binding protein
MVNRRLLLAGAAATSAALPALPPTAIAQDGPEITWRCTSSFPRSLDTIYGGAEVFSDVLSGLTGGRFKVEVYQAGEIVPGLQALDAVSEGKVELCHSCSYYFVGKDPTFAFGTAVPFGLNGRLQNAWLTAGGGEELLNEFYKKYNVFAIAAGNTGCQMGGWFRNELRSLDDLDGLKMRIAGIAGQILQTVGVMPQQIAGGEIYAALENGTVDAAEWVGPYDDEKLGFYKLAKYYYYPGWWEAATTIHLFFNIDQWESLPEPYKVACRAAAGYATLYMQAKYDVQNPAALKRLVTEGVELRPFPQDIMQASFNAANTLYAEIGAANPDFKRIYDHWDQFRSDGYLWWLVDEIAMDAFMVRARAARHNKS